MTAPAVTSWRATTPAAPGIGLSRVVVRVPRQTEAVGDILARAGRPETERRMFSRIYGLDRSPTLNPDESTTELLAAAGRDALDGSTAGLVLYGHTLSAQEFGYRGGFPDRLRSALGLSGTPCYGVSQVNCTSVLRCVELARRYLTRSGSGQEDAVLVLGGDHGSANDHSRVIPGITVGGDGVVGFLMHRTTGTRRPRYRYLAGALSRHARFYRNLRMSGPEAAEFGRVCGEEAVRVVTDASERAGLSIDQLDWVLPQLSNRMFWKTFCGRSGIPKERIHLEPLAEWGHNFGTDALLALEHADRAGRLRPGNRCALVAIGHGGYFQALIVQVVEDT